MPHRRLFIERYRIEQNKIMANQFSLLTTIKMILNGVKLVTNSTYTYQINQLCVGSHEHFMNCLHMRKYLRNLFAPKDEMPIASDSEDEDEGSGTEAEKK